MKYVLKKIAHQDVPSDVVKKQMFAELFGSIDEGELIKIDTIKFECQRSIIHSNNYNGVSVCDYAPDYAPYTDYVLQVTTKVKPFTSKQFDSIANAVCRHDMMNPTEIRMHDIDIESMKEYARQNIISAPSGENENLFICGLKVVSDNSLKPGQFIIK